MIPQQIQKDELAGKTKLTAVTVYVSPSRKTTHFVMITHDSRGKAVIPMSFLNQLIGATHRGVTISVA